MSRSTLRIPVFVISIGIFLLFVGIYSYKIKTTNHLITSSTYKPPLDTAGLPLPDVSARHVLIKDLTSGEILYSKDADSRISPASTTKMMTALVAVQDYGWDKEIIVSKPFHEGSIAGFKKGEVYTVEQLVYSLLLRSANDAAEILAQAHPLGRAGFVADMNKTSTQLGLSSTEFKNPSGLDEDGHLSSAADLTRLGEYLVTQPVFSRIVSAESASILDSSSNSGHLFANSNPLLGKVPGVLGIKTGFTDNAGQSLVSLVSRGGRTILVTVLGSQNREADSKNLIEWTFKNYTWN